MDQRIQLLNDLSDVANHLLMVWIVAGAQPMTVDALAALIGRARGTTARALLCLKVNGVAVHPHYREWQLTGAWRQLPLAESSKLELSETPKAQKLSFQTLESSSFELSDPSSSSFNNNNKRDLRSKLLAEWGIGYRMADVLKAMPHVKASVLITEQHAVWAAISNPIERTKLLSWRIKELCEGRRERRSSNAAKGEVWRLLKESDHER